MPGLKGAELTRRVREQFPEMKIIMISSHTDDAYRMQASDSGANAFINKRVINSSLISAIRDLTGQPPFGGSGPCPGGAASSAAPQN